MHNKTKIVVLHMKELIYTAIFAALAILFVILLIYMFGKKDSDEAMETMDENHINSVRLVNITETVTTMFPLVEPAFDSIAGQIYEGVELSNITYDQESRYTSLALIQAIQASLDKASAAKVSQNGM